MVSSLLGCHFSINGEELLNDFSELYQNLCPIYAKAGLSLVAERGGTRLLLKLE
jgi:hypothetical protein